MNETFIQRLDKYMEYAELNDNKVTVQCELTVGIINSARKRNKSLSGENIGKILHTYKDLNARWLLTGEGEMIRDIYSESDNVLVMYLKEENRKLTTQLHEAKEKIGFLQGQMTQMKKINAQTDDNVVCADAG